MIKFNSLWQKYFSTLKFSQRHIKMFHFSRQLRSFISLNHLNHFAITHKQDIENFGKTIFLQYMNQFPMNYTIKTFQPKMDAYKMAIQLQGLSLYEEQIKYSLLTKMYQYMGWESQYLQKLIIAQEKKIINLANQEGFDIVDALNLIIAQRSTCSSPEIIDYALKIICQTSLSRSGSMMTKLLNSFLKKMEELEWKGLRKHRKIFQFLCTQYELSNESTKIMITNLSKLTNLKLHVLDYNIIPKAIGQIFAKIDSDLKKIDFSSLQLLFKSFDNLPTNYNRNLYRKIYEQILQKGKNQKIKLYYIPITKITLQQLDNIIKLFFSKNFNFNEALYFINMSENSKKLLQQFLKSSNRYQLYQNLAAYLSVGGLLLDYYNYNESKQRELIVNHIKNIMNILYKYYSQAQILNCQNSLCSWFNLYSLQLQFGIFINRKQFQIKFNDIIVTFINKIASCNMKTKKRYIQIKQVLQRYVNSNHIEIKRAINKIIRSDIEKSQKIDFFLHPYLIFTLEQVQTRQIYQQSFKAIYASFNQDFIDSFIDNYIRYPHKNKKLNNILINRIWQFTKNPQLIFKLFTSIHFIYFENGFRKMSDSLTNLLLTITSKIKNEHIQKMNINQIIKIIRFYNYFQNSLKLNSSSLLTKIIKCIDRKPQILNNASIEIQMEYGLQVGQYIVCLKQNVGKIELQNIGYFDGLIKNLIFDNNLLIPAQQIYLNILLKDYIHLDSEKINEVIKKLLNQSENGYFRNESILLLIKLYLIGEINLKNDELRYCEQMINKGYKNKQIGMRHIMDIFGFDIMNKINMFSSDKIIKLTNMVSNCFKYHRQTQDHHVNLYYLQLATCLKSNQLIQITLDKLALITLDPPYLPAISTLLTPYPNIYHQPLLLRIVKDMNMHFGILEDQYLEILFYLNIVEYDGCKQNHNCRKMLKKIEQQLYGQANNLINNGPCSSQQINNFLIKSYKYYWIVIKNKLVSTKTVTLFSINIKFIKNVYQLLSKGAFEPIQPRVIYLIHHYLIKNNNCTQIQKTSKKIFTSKIEKQFKLTRENNFNEEYIQCLNNISLLVKQQYARYFALEYQLKSHQIQEKSQQKQKNTNFYIFLHEYKGIQIEYYVKYKQKNYFIFRQYKKEQGQRMRKLQVIEELYRGILDGQCIFLKDGRIIRLSFS